MGGIEDAPGEVAATKPATADAANKPAPGAQLAATTAGESTSAKIDTLFSNRFTGTELGHHTALWNMVHAFKEDVKKLVGDTPAA